MLTERPPLTGAGTDAHLQSKPSSPTRSPFVSFAQNFEDVMLWRALGHIPSGFYIDIGACEPEAHSVTKAFYDRGWSGINIEPARSPFARLATARPRDSNLCLLVSDSEGARDFFLIGEENGLSTAVPELAERHAAAGWSCQAVTVQATTLAKICDQHVRGQIHFLKIDAEWSELAILRGADFKRFRPWIVLFEAKAVGDRPHAYEDCDRVLEQAEYRFLYADGLNHFWAAEEHYAELAPHFAVPPNVFDGFVRASEVAAQAEMSRAEVAAADAQAQLDRTLAERDTISQELYETNRFAAALTVERQVLLERVGSLKSHLDAVYASTSWKFAWPVRAARRVLKGGRR
ncbi:MAG TPA: FkbM family methyltransferase [Rhodopila sp.]|nr:FkbM family methyltransferase [Rhodopila sp.]